MDNVSELIGSWVDDISGEQWVWYVKRLSGNDTLLTGGHQAGPYVPKSIVFEILPSLAASKTLNPREQFPVVVDSHSAPERIVTAIWYNNKLHSDSGTRNECRITNWGGSDSPLLDPDSTGSLAVFAFHIPRNGNTDICRVWLCSSIEEEDVFESYVGDVEPGKWLYLSTRGNLEFAVPTSPIRPCALSEEEIQNQWGRNYPTGVEIVEKVLTLTPTLTTIGPDNRLLRRRDCEFVLFKSIENFLVLPKVQHGFHSIDEFTDYANSVLNRRKSRSGRSLELHAAGIFNEEGLTRFSHDQKSEGNKRPDFIFPSVTAYRDDSFPTEKLRMLAAKTTCKDRWRQVIREADRIGLKHLLTLQEGVSLNQFKEMEDAGIQLVVPEPLHRKYHEDIRAKIMRFDNFITETKALCE